MGYRSSTEGGYGIGASTDHVDASHTDRIDVPDAELLFRGHFARSGPDLILTGQDGHRLVVTGYFTTEKHPDLVAPNGAHLTGDLVDLLAGSPTPGQYAQAKTTLPPDAIGKVEKVVGQVMLIHNGVAGPLHVGDAVYKTDIVETAANSSCGIAFPDGTALDLVNNTRMALNEYNYEANSASNGALFSLVEGTFAFVAGQVAHTGEGLKINTPVATMGVRGTVGLFRTEPTIINSNLGHVWSVFLHEDIDGSHHLGRIALIDQDPTSPTFGQTFYLLDSSDYIAYLEPQGGGQPPHVRLEPITNSRIFENRHFFNDLGKIIESYNNADPQSPSTPGSGDNPSDLFQQQLFQDDGGKPLFNFAKLGSGDQDNIFSSSLPLTPVMGGLLPNTNITTSITTSNEPTPLASTIFIWNGTGAWPTALANWNSGAAPNSPIDSVIIQTGTATFNLPNTTISSLTVDPSAALDIVGGQLNTGGLIDNGTISVDGDPPALVVAGPAIMGSGGTFTVQDGSVSFTNGSLLNAGTLTADLDGSVLINESGINSGIIRAIDGGVVTIENGTTVNSGTIKADGGTIALYSSYVDNKDGLITALGCAALIVLADTAVAGGTIEARHDGVVDLDHATIIGSTIETSCGGFVQTVCGNSTLQDATIACGSDVLVNCGTSLTLVGDIHDWGAIVVGPPQSQGDPDLIIKGDVKLDGSGSVVLNGANDSIVASHEGSTLTNDSNIVGAGHVGNGDGSLWLVNENCGTIDANSCEQALTLDTGCNQITNAGTLAADNGGRLEVDSSVNNTCGSIKVSDGGFADFEKSVTGGTAVVQGGELKFDAASSVDVRFDNSGGHYGELILGDAKGFSGTIFGFNGQESECPSLLTSDEIDLLGIAACNVCFSEDANGNAIITIKNLGTITIDNFDFSNLEKASDGHGGTIIFDSPAAASTSPSVSIGGAGNDTFVFHPGGGSQTVNNFDPQHDTIELDQFANIHNVQELAAAITPDMHGNAVLELGHGDSIAIPGVSATYLQHNLQSLVHLHA
jgi:hypothetical protein